MDDSDVEIENNQVPLTSNIERGAADEFGPIIIQKPKSFQEIQSAIIDPKGTFKYIQIDVVNSVTGEKKRVVRGYECCSFHPDILGIFNLKELADVKDRRNLQTSCPGGGRIRHSPEEKEIYVYGYSQSYGQADHDQSKQLLEETYKGYKIHWSNEGY